MPSRAWNDLDAQVQRALITLQSQTERRILLAYAQSLKDIRTEMGRLYERVKTPDGKLTLAEMTKYNRLNTLEKNIAEIMKESNGIVLKELRRLGPEMYDESYFRYGWAFDQNSAVSLSWGTVQPDTLKAISDNPLDLIARDTLPTLTRNRIRTSISQGLLQGKAFPKMMRDIRKAMGNNTFEAMRIARTEGQRAQAEGTNANYDRAIENGIEGTQIWDATIDSRTRETHITKDGEIRAADGLFSSLGGVRPRFPVDPVLSAKEAINCRCRLRFEIEGYSPQIRRTRSEGVVPYTTFEDWQKDLNARGRFDISKGRFGPSGKIAPPVIPAWQQTFKASVQANELMVSAFRNAPADLKKKISQMSKIDDIEFGVGRSYAEGRSTIRFRNGADAGTASHEYGHILEHAMDRELKANLFDAIADVNKKTRRSSAAGKQLSDEISEEIRDRRTFIKPNGFMGIDKAAPDPDVYMADYFGAITRERIGRGHGRAYYQTGSQFTIKGVSFMQMTEVMANLTNMYARADRAAWNTIKRFTPEITKVFEAWLKV